MNFTFLKAACLSVAMVVCSTASAGLMTGTNIEIEAESVSYVEFSLISAGEINWQLTGLPDGNDVWGDVGYNYALLEGSFGSFGSLLKHDMTNGLNKAFTDTFSAGTYTFAVGVYKLTEEEARSGTASTPISASQLYNFSLSGDTLVSNQIPAPLPSLVPEPTTLAIFALSLIGLASRRAKK